MKVGLAAKLVDCALASGFGWLRHCVEEGFV